MLRARRRGISILKKIPFLPHLLGTHLNSMLIIELVDSWPPKFPLWSDLVGEGLEDTDILLLSPSNQDDIVFRGPGLYDIYITSTNKEDWSSRICTRIIHIFHFKSTNYAIMYDVCIQEFSVMKATLDLALSVHLFIHL